VTPKSEKGAFELERHASTATQTRPLGELLIARGVATAEQVQWALARQKQAKAPLGQILISAQLVSERDLTDALGEQLGVPVVDLREQGSQEDALSLIDQDYAEHNKVLPLRTADNVLHIACADPENLQLLNEVGVMSRRQLEVYLAPADELEEAIQQRYRVLSGVAEYVKAFEDADHGPAIAEASISEISQNAPVVQIVNLLIRQGLRDRASDIHIEPKKDHVRVRYRIDGVLTEALRLPIRLAPGIASRIKIMAELDIVERHRSQDGQIQMTVDGRPIDIRVATVETIWGEKVVLRLLDKARTLLQLHELGCGETHYQQLSRLLRSPFGMIVVSGPTGSGKTTTLYAAVNELDGVGRNIMTIEDPVEYTFEDVNQVQIRRMAQITFANGLKAILRQDPDVILVGEIRDRETAEIAVQSALTGHLVLSSLHATDSAGVLQRFVEMGIEPFLISSSVIGVVAQRLVRRICERCGETYALPPDEAALHRQLSTSAKQSFSRGAGCAHCARTGYRGRVGVFEVLTLTDPLKRLLSERSSVAQLREQAARDGMISMRQDAVAKVDEDVTTMSEVIRSVYLS
jgi:type IV pilus assembly protein PilB